MVPNSGVPVSDTLTQGYALDTHRTCVGHAFAVSIFFNFRHDSGYEKPIDTTQLFLFYFQNHISFKS